MTDFVVPSVVAGKNVAPEEVFDVLSPANGQVLHQCGLATTSLASEAVVAAASASKDWAQTSTGRRREIFLAAAAILESEKDMLAGVMKDEVCAEQEWAEHNIKASIKMLESVADNVSSLNGLSPTLADTRLSGLIVHEPYGVVLAIAPWNAPYILGLRSFLFPIAAGCTVVFKGSELSPRVHYLLVNVLHRAGLPKGVLNYIVTTSTCAQSVTESLIANPCVRKINFTGSTRVGAIIAELAGRHLKPTVMELGGKASAIVWNDADLDLAVKECVTGAFLFHGQICMSTERILVHTSICEEFYQRLSREIQSTRFSSQEQLVLINPQSVAKNKRLLKDAVDKGATVLLGDLDQVPSSTQMQRSILKGVTPNMDIYKTESFGPSVSLIEVSSEAEALCESAPAFVSLLRCITV
ncbi:Vanillin dehydrogenase [Paramyrothecium foliicola]|nr:Vanillin dehydrogenase [Paramyrothecium foliicola]